MGISARPMQGVVVRTGADRATLVRRTYSLVFVSILVTIIGTAFGMSQPSGNFRKRLAIRDRMTAAGTEGPRALQATYLPSTLAKS